MDSNQPLPDDVAVLRRELQQTQAALHAAQAEATRVRELLDLARQFGRVGVWERDLRNWRGHWDEQVYGFWGLPRGDNPPSVDEAVCQVAATDRDALVLYFRESLKRAGSYAYRYRIRQPDGTLKRVHSQWLVKNGADGEPERLIGLLVDDSEPFQMAPAAGELESLLALAVDLGGIAIWRHDLVTQRMHYSGQAWRVLEIPPRPEGLTLEEVREFIHPDDLPQVLASAQAALSSDRPTDMEARYRRSDGTWRDVLTRRVVQRAADGTPLAFVGVAMDVTDRRSTGQALRRANERVALVTRAVGLGTWEVDLVEGRVFWDDGMWALRGHPPRPNAPDAAERLSFVHPEDRELAAANTSRQPSRQPGQIEYRVVWPDGQQRWIASRSLWLYDDAGTPVRRIGVNWDITDARDAEAARQQQDLALRENQARSRFLARMSHELRTPLNAVLGFTQLLLADASASPATPTRDSQRQRLEHIHAAGRHLLALINDVLDLASLQSGELRIDSTALALAPLVEQTVSLLGPTTHTQAWPAGVRVLLGELDHRVMADATRLRQVLLNLLSNAVKYNQPGGEVRISARTAAPGQVLITVEDTGQGMDEAQLRQLFEPFNRLGRETATVEGHGIGLAIAKALVEGMGGRIEVTSRLGQGTRFELRLPAPVGAAVAAPAAPTEFGALDGPDAGPRRRILYIEDNPVNALIIEQLLQRRSDLALRVAENGESGVAVAGEWLPELILLDMQLPDFDGIEVMRRLRKQPQTARIPCVALSANAMPQDIENALRAGAADYWTKPLDFKAFMARLDTMFAPQPQPTMPAD